MEVVLGRRNEEIIELDLNRNLPHPVGRYTSYMDEVERLSSRPEKEHKQFITIVEDL